MTASGAPDDGVLIGLSAVVMALRGQALEVLTIRAGEGEGSSEARGLPFGPFDPLRHRTFELALRAFVTAQTGFRLGFVEQLYTFGDAGRDAPRAEMGAGLRRVVSVGYLALTPDAGRADQDRRRDAADVAGADWSPVLTHFPWEDYRAGRPPLIDAVLAPALATWAGQDPVRCARIDDLFALRPGLRWNEGRVLDRYELLYEAGLVPEAVRDRTTGAALPGLGLAMASDHRRILATGLGRLRSKLKYRPVLFDLMPQTFTLSELQIAAEAVSGLTLHKQNFRRGVERTGLVEPTGRLSTGTGGRPAELFRYRAGETSDHARYDSLPFDGDQGLPLPAQR